MGFELKTTVTSIILGTLTRVRIVLKATGSCTQKLGLCVYFTWREGSLIHTYKTATQVAAVESFHSVTEDCEVSYLLVCVPKGW